MASTSVSNRGVAYALLALVGTILLYIFGFSRGIDMVREGSLERANNQAKIDALKQKIQDLRNLEEQFAQNKGQVDALGVAMPADKQLAEIVTMMDTMAARAGLTLENVQPTSTATLDGLPVTVTVRGSYEGTLSFAELMEKNVRPIRIGPVNISAGETLTTTFNVIALYQVPPEDLPESESPPDEGGESS